MAASPTTVTISGVQYPVYADVAMADEYLAASMQAAAWRALTDPDDKARALVSATRLLDRQQWKGEKRITSPEQQTEWPRTGTGIPGVVDGVVPDNIIMATEEIASALVSGSDMETESNTANKISSLQAGSVSLSFFRGAEGEATRFPTIVNELLQGYLAGSGELGLAGALSTGVDGVSETREDFGLNSGI